MMNNVFVSVSYATGLRGEDLFVRSRKRHELLARYIAIQLLREQGLSQRAIAQMTGASQQGIGKALRAHEQLMVSDYLYRNSFSVAKKKFDSFSISTS